MFNVCAACGLYRADKIIDPSGPDAICPVCGHRHPFRSLPLMLVSGASGTGKTTVCQKLIGQISEAVLLDTDILWRPEFNKPDDQYRDFFETWLRMAKNIGQSGRPVVLFGAGVGVPENLEMCIERRYFSALHYLALTCEESVLTRRLQDRPQWRDSHDPVVIDEQIRFNQWFGTNTIQNEAKIELLDTTTVSVQTTAEDVAAWIRRTAWTEL